MSRLDDLAINCAARRVLVRHWIDLGRAALRTTKGVLTVHGTLDRLPQSNNPLAPSDVRELASELRRIPAVRRVQMEFTNWVEKDGAWLRASAQSTAHLLKHKAQPEDGVYVIDESELPKDISQVT